MTCTGGPVREEALPGGVAKSPVWTGRIPRNGHHYDTPRVTESDADESLDELETRRRNDAATAVLDVDDDAVDSFKLPDADLSGRQICADCV
jgi:hypothetical protein